MANLAGCILMKLYKKTKILINLLCVSAAIKRTKMIRLWSTLTICSSTLTTYQRRCIDVKTTLCVHRPRTVKCCTVLGNHQVKAANPKNCIAHRKTQLKLHIDRPTVQLLYSAVSVSLLINVFFKQSLALSL